MREMGLALEAETRHPRNRRWWILFLAGTALVATLAGVQIARRGGDWVRAGSLDEIREAGVIYLEDHLVFVVADDDRVLALSAISPHRPELGERVLFCRSSGWFEAPHGEKFDRWGVYADGPAPRGLDRVRFSVRDDTVEVMPEDFITGPPRGSRPLEPPIGPFCRDELGESAPGFARELDPR